MTQEILWIDDEIDSLRSHTLFLQSRGYRVTTASNARDGLALLAERRFDAALLDHHMVGMSGLEALDAIKASYPRLPVVMITQSHEDALMDEALRGRVDDFLVKPTQAVQVARTLRRLLDRKRVEAEGAAVQYLNEYRELSALTDAELDWRGWMETYRRLCAWDMRIDELKAVGLDANHAELRADLNRRFSNYAAEHYGSWARGESDSPPLSTDVLDRHVLPLLREGTPVFFVVIDCMRYDLWLTIQPLLAEMFHIETELYYGVLPTATAYARNALFSGLFPSEIAERYPDCWSEDVRSAEGLNRHEKRLLELKLERSGLELWPAPRYFKIFDPEGGRLYRKRAASYDRFSLACLVVNFVDALTHERSHSQLLRQIAPDEASFCSLFRSWFQNSDLYEIFRLMGDKGAAVVVTTDHGSVLCNRASKVFGDRDTASGLRFKFGKRVQCAEESAAAAVSPSEYRLPSDFPGKNYVFAKEDYYFVYPSDFQVYRKKLKGGFQHGGISMEEMLIPCVLMRRR